MKKSGGSGLPGVQGRHYGDVDKGASDENKLKMGQRSKCKSKTHKTVKNIGVKSL